MSANKLVKTVLSEPTATAVIYIAGDLGTIRHACRKFCDRGLCVTVEPTEFVYTRGAESGARIGLVNYPRFPSTAASLFDTANTLALFLLDEAVQDSALIVSNEQTIWLSRRS